jgi:hypothetical protein
MKLHITPEQLLELTESQKQNLRDMWMPEVNTLAMARICMDVINDEYDNIVFVIGDILVHENRGNLILRRYRLLDDSFFEENKSLFDDEGDFEFEYSEPEQFFNKEDCLPLLSIGELIKLLNRVRYGQDGYKIFIPPVRRAVGDADFSVINSIELEYQDEELCDALWNALKDCL